MNPEDYISAWKPTHEDPLYTASLETLNNLPLNNTTKLFLNKVGLPDGAAPFLNFELNPRPGNYGLVFINEIFDFLDESYSKLISIGADGEGSPIVIDTVNNDSIVLLDHEFDFETKYINGSIEQFFKSIRVYKNFATTVFSRQTEETFNIDAFTDEQYNMLKTELYDIESKAVSEGTFWNQELQMLLDNREYYLSNK